MNLETALFCSGAYLVGSLPVGVWTGRAYGVDVRSAGSGNVGATNVWRTVGPLQALFVLLLDVAKGYAPAALAGWLLSAEGFSPVYALAAGGFAVLGHTASPFLRFRGGKGVATGLGVLVAATPEVAAVALMVWAALLLALRYMSFSSVCAAASAPVTAALLGKSPPVVYIYIGLAMLVVVNHRSNIRRLLRGEESKFSFKSTPKGGRNSDAGNLCSDERENGDSEGGARMQGGDHHASESETPRLSGKGKGRRT
ncbi:MAG: glycerol-3-phosphate 1-O-acyltransferase PlsY [Armatimonadetes bacterium]|nr:glycerol-3-phosphate 1-O-acyltransferase PlsY [Armatimonadota bacterium]